MKVNCRACDVCGERLGERDFQCWLRKPIIRWGALAIRMPCMDICGDCLNKMAIMIQHPEIFKLKWEEIGNEDSV